MFADKKRRRAIAVFCCFVFMTVLISAGLYFLDWRLGKEIIVNGKVVGVVQNSDKLDEIMEDVEGLSKVAAGDKPVLEVSSTTKIVQKKSVSSDFEIKQNILSECENMVQAYAIYVNSALVAASLDEASAFEALDTVKNQYAKDGQLTIEFLDRVVVRYEYVPQTKPLETSKIIDVLNGTTKYQEVYTPIVDEEMSNISQRYGMSLEDLHALNPNSGDIVKANEKINVESIVDNIRIKVTTLEDYDKVLLSDTEEVPDTTLEEGKTKVVTNGVTGLARVSATITWVNGYEQGREPISEVVLKEPVKGKVRVGTKTVLNGGNNNSDGFMWPASGPITSQTGARWGRNHDGIDLGSAYGSAIRASVAGTVTLAAWNGDYGNCIRINSGGGFVEIYAHLSEILVTEGQVVRKGELIGRVGNTGRSTGPHLHFEIRKDGIPVNPLSYLPKR